MRIGKLDSKELKRNIFGVLKKRRDEVKVSSSLAQDCASFELSGISLISTDPITAAVNNLGELAIKINANDIYAAGGEPVLAVLTVLAPPEATPEEVKALILGAEREAEKQNIEIAGGHTEFTDAVNRMVASVTIIGKAERHIRGDGARAGDFVIMTKTAGIEGTAVLACDMEDKLNGFLSSEESAYAKSLNERISIAKEAAAARQEDVHAMHDVTEGGIFGAVCEMAEAANLGVELDADKIPLLDVTRKICDCMSIDPYRLISSGCLLIAASDAERVIHAIEKAGVKAAVIGRFTEGKEIAATINGKKIRLSSGSDELFKAKGSGKSNGNGAALNIKNSADKN